MSGRAARCWAARPRSTACSTSAASAADYDGWRQLGCEGWGWDDVLPYFLQSRAPGARRRRRITRAGGPLNVSDVTEGHEVSDAVVEACVGGRHPAQPGPQRRKPGRRRLVPADRAERPALLGGGRLSPPGDAAAEPAVETRALAHAVLFEGRRAVGVEYLHGGARKTRAPAAEVILCGGAVNSPQLLQLSGVGPAALLAEHGIAVVADLPGVGENLQDHYVILAAWRLKTGVISVNELSHGPRFLGETMKYLFTRKGLLTLSAAHIAVFCKSRPELAGPDIQFHILPATTDMEKYATSR